jgi:tetratricopeptide (TPR) repeat protein
MLKEEKQPFWQAVAASILSPWGAAPDVLPALITALDHTDPLVRENAARSLEPLAQEHNADAREALAKHLQDPIRAVRIRAASALRDTLPPESAPMQDLLASFGFEADQPIGQWQLGLYHLARNDFDPAIVCFKKAIAWDPNSAPFYESLAVALSKKGNYDQAIEPLQQAMHLDPREAEYPYKLALAYSELQQLDRAIQFFNQTLTINARHSRAAYNLGLAYSQTNQLDQAIAALNRAQSINPNDPQIPYALATIYIKLNQKHEARDAAMRSLRLDPASTDAAELLQALGR